jgi:leader peptidase (prepilin peptidase) / N-methyltransferase
MVTPVIRVFFLVFSFVLGTVVGSFLNVCIYRLPHNQSIIKPRSKCPRCGALIAWYDNIPLLSWLILGAKCRHCGAPISWQYPLVEGLTGVLFMAVYWRFGWDQGMTVAVPIYMAFAAALVLVAFVDLTDWTIPNEVTLPGIPLGIACSVLGMVYPDSGLLVTGVFDSLLGVVIGGGVHYILDKVSVAVLRKRGMGFGDVKLGAMIGAFLGWKGVLLVVMAASILGSVIGVTLIALQKARGEAEPSHYLPFGPYLSVGGLMTLFFGQAILDIYLGMLATAPAEPF